MVSIARPLFKLGKTGMTQGVAEIIPQSMLMQLMYRHHHGVWTELTADDEQANYDAIQNGDRIVSHYTITIDDERIRVYIITEADRSSTLVQLSREY